MIDFAPLKWVVATLTVWHLGIWASLAAFLGWSAWRRAQLDTGSQALVEFAFGQLSLIFVYVLGALILGQIFGDKFKFSQVWPTSMVLGVILAAGFVLYVQFMDRGAPQVAFKLFAFLFFSIFLGLGLNLFLYALPRSVGWGLFEIPTASWGVKL